MNEGVRSLVDLLHRRASENPDRVGFTYLADGEHPSQTLTFRELDVAARFMAQRLLGVVRPGDRALLISSSGLEFLVGFFGCLYAGVIGVPVPSPHAMRPERSMGRLLAIARSAEPGCVIAKDSDIERMHRRSGEPFLDGVPFVDAEIEQSARDNVDLPRIEKDGLAFLQYTSGSTAEPKGVMITHRNLLHNLGCIHWFSENDAGSRGVSWLPLHHDMGLIEGVLQPIYGDYPVWLMPPAAFLQKPARWLRAISRYGATNSGAPDFAYSLCARRVPDDELVEMDLSSWRVAYNGSEPVRPSTIEEFVSRFGPCGFRSRSFYPVYGLAEATLVVSSCRLADEPQIGTLSREHGEFSAVGCGRTTGGTEVRVVDPDRRVELPFGKTGEIWVRSESVGRGYWNRPRLSAETFAASLSDGDGPFLRTGDLGVVREDGQLVVVGRIKDLLIFRGRKHHPTDLESSAEASHDSLRAGSCAACGIRSSNDTSLAILAELDAAVARDEQVVSRIFAAMRREIALDHGVQVERIVVFSPHSLPRTTSGKLQRHLCSKLLTDGAGTALAQWPSVGAADRRRVEAASS